MIDPDRPVLVSMQAALDVDRDGRVTAVTFVDDAKLPDAIRERGEEVAKSWTFVPPIKAGEAVSGRTFAAMTACVVPSDDGLEFTVAYAGNGPGTSYLPPRRRKAVMPVGKLVSQGVNGLRGTIVYVVSADGKAQLESATLDEPELQRRYGDLWKRDQREVQKNTRYLPELIDGVPIATRVETASVQEWVRTGDGEGLARIQARVESSDACKALRGDNGRQIASDSPFKLIGG